MTRRTLTSYVPAVVCNSLYEVYFFCVANVNRRAGGAYRASSNSEESNLLEGYGQLRGAFKVSKYNTRVLIKLGINIVYLYCQYDFHVDHIIVCVRFIYFVYLFHRETEGLA